MPWMWARSGVHIQGEGKGEEERGFYSLLKSYLFVLRLDMFFVFFR